jgi:hypothetical protein
MPVRCYQKNLSIVLDRDPALYGSIINFCMLSICCCQSDTNEFQNAMYAGLLDIESSRLGFTGCSTLWLRKRLANTTLKPESRNRKIKIKS